MQAAGCFPSLAAVLRPRLQDQVGRGLGRPPHAREAALAQDLAQAGFTRLRPRYRPSFSPIIVSGALVIAPMSPTTLPMNASSLASSIAVVPIGIAL
jgi:hypothetical protein